MDSKIDADLTRMRAVPLSVSKGKSETKASVPSRVTNNDAAESSSILRSQRMLLDKLNDLPEIRPEKVEYGKKLVQSENYPPPQDLERLASKLLGNLEDSSEEN